MGETGVFGRLGVSTRAGVTALVAGVVGLGALVASMIVDWQGAALSSRTGGNDPGFSTVLEERFALGLARLPYADVYLLGVLGLLGLLGTALARPDRAARLRFTAVALGVGLAALVLVMVLDGKATLGGFAVDDSTAIHVQLLAGGWWALGAVVAPVVGVWLTVRPGEPAAELPSAPGAPAPVAVPTHARAAVDYLDGLTVTGSEPIDIASGEDVLRT